MKKTNAGYVITDFISLEGANYVLAHHPSTKCPAPYVVWRADAQMENFWFGHYFTEKPEAITDMIQRSTHALERSDGIPLAVDFLEDNAREAVATQLADEKANEFIQESLEQVLSNNERYPAGLTAETLMKNSEFASLARSYYDCIDHTEEYYAMQDGIENILDDHPQFWEPLKLHSEVRISPEQSALIKDLLSMPTAAVPEKYGPLGDNIEFIFSFADGRKAALTLVPSYTPGSTKHNEKLSETEPHHVVLSAWDSNDNLLGSNMYTPAELGEGGMAGVYDVLKNDSVTMTLELVEDESLRRMGNPFIFRPSTESDPYIQHDGETCTIQRALTPNECDILCSGLMWEAKFPNGDVLHVFDDELEPLEPSRKPTLQEMISEATEKASLDSYGPEGKGPER